MDVLNGNSLVRCFFLYPRSPGRTQLECSHPNFFMLKTCAQFSENYGNLRGERMFCAANDITKAEISS